MTSKIDETTHVKIIRIGFFRFEKNKEIRIFCKGVCLILYKVIDKFFIVT